jgi:hypothetical protein
MQTSQSAMVKLCPAGCPTKNHAHLNREDEGAFGLCPEGAL